MAPKINPKFIDQSMTTDDELNAASVEDRKRSNHTGTQPSSTISDFSSAVLSTTLVGYIKLSGQVTETDTVLSALGKTVNAADKVIRTRSRIASNISATSTTFTSVGDKFLWIQQRNIGSKNGIISLAVNMQGRGFEARLVNMATGQIHGSIVVLATEGTDVLYRTFSITTPTADCQLEFQIKKTISGGTSPVVETAIIEFDS